MPVFLWTSTGGPKKGPRTNLLKVGVFGFPTAVNTGSWEVSGFPTCKPSPSGCLFFELKLLA